MAHPTPGAKRKDGITCERCGHFEPFSPYVYAHWDIPLFYACKTEGCGKRYETLAGTITQLENDNDRKA